MENQDQGDKPKTTPDHSSIPRPTTEPILSTGERVMRERMAWRDVIAQIGKAYAGATIDNFQFHGSPEFQRRQKLVLDQVRQFCARMNQNVANGCNVLFSGACGTGKDHLMVGMIREAIKAGCYELSWVSACEMFGDLRDAIGAKSVTQGEAIGDLYRPKLLIISDLLPINLPLTPYEAEMLFRLIDARHRRLKATWVTCNVATREEAVEKIGAKILSRLDDDALKLNFQWDDYRRIGCTWK